MFTALLLTIALNPQTATPAQAATPRFVPERRFQLSELKTVPITIDGKHRFTAWVMDTFDKRMEGMMFLRDTDFRDDQAMLFVFKKPEIQRFWMRNTLVPLDIAYISPDMTINSTYTMAPRDETTDYSSAAPAALVLEARGGLFRKLGIRPGQTVTIHGEVRAVD